MIFLLISVFIFVALYDIPDLIRKKYWRELVVFSILFLSIFGIVLLQFSGITIPSPIKGVQYILKDLLHLNYQIL